MKQPIGVVLCIVATLVLASCAWAGDSQVERKNGDGKMTILRLSDDYVIGQGDVIEVFVWRNEQLSREVVVRPDGKISLPLLQDIQAGLSRVRRREI